MCGWGIGACIDELNLERKGRAPGLRAGRCSEVGERAGWEIGACIEEPNLERKGWAAGLRVGRVTGLGDSGAPKVERIGWKAGACTEEPSERGVDTSAAGFRVGTCVVTVTMG